MLKQLAEDYLEYAKECKHLWDIEVKRASENNQMRLERRLPGFTFPERDEKNTPSFDGFMMWLVRKYVKNVK